MRKKRSGYKSENPTQGASDVHLRLQNDYAQVCERGEISVRAQITIHASKLRELIAVRRAKIDCHCTGCENWFRSAQNAKIDCHHAAMRELISQCTNCKNWFQLAQAWENWLAQVFKRSFQITSAWKLISAYDGLYRGLEEEGRGGDSRRNWVHLCYKEEKVSKRGLFTFFFFWKASIAVTSNEHYKRSRGEKHVTEAPLRETIAAGTSFSLTFFFLPSFLPLSFVSHYLYLPPFSSSFLKRLYPNLNFQHYYISLVIHLERTFGIHSWDLVLCWRKVYLLLFPLLITYLPDFFLYYFFCFFPALAITQGGPIAPPTQRSFPMQTWPCFDQDKYNHLLELLPATQTLKGNLFPLPSICSSIFYWDARLRE